MTHKGAGIMADRVRWGILSTANIGRAALVPAIQTSGNGEIVAVASRDTERAFGYATRFNIPASYGSYEELLRHPGLDAVYVPLPNSLHYEWVLRALDAGLHVLCEKPMGLSAEECLEMATAADERDLVLMEAFMYRFHPQITTAQSLIQQGAIGALKHMHAAFTFRLTRAENIRLQPELGGGALMDVGCFAVNIFRTFAGEEPVEVQAFARWHENGVDEQMTGTLRFPGGVTAQFDCALDMVRREAFMAAGSDGVLDLPRAFLPGTGSTVVLVRKGYNEIEQQIIPGVDEYRLMVEHMGDCIRNGLKPRVTGHEAAFNMRVVEALYRSASADGQPMPVLPLPAAA